MADYNFVTLWRFDAPLARPLFKWNHDVVMAWGAEGLNKRLKESQKAERRTMN